MEGADRAVAAGSKRAAENLHFQSLTHTGFNLGLIILSLFYSRASSPGLKGRNANDDDQENSLG